MSVSFRNSAVALSDELRRYCFTKGGWNTLVLSYCSGAQTLLWVERDSAVRECFTQLLLKWAMHCWQFINILKIFGTFLIYKESPNV